MDKGVDDSKIPLSNIAQHHGKPIVSLLLDIQKTQQQPQRKYLRFIRRLECLSVNESSKEELVRPIGSLKPRSWSQRITLIRRKINAFKEENYVALSYTWEGSDYEDQSSGKYEVQTRDERQFFPSPVRILLLAQGKQTKLLQEIFSNHFGMNDLFHGIRDSFFVTNKGYFGRAPAETVERGQVVAVLGGAYVPYLLQKQNDHYQLISHAYVEGIMTLSSLPMT